jgi:hypothetical protein
MSSVPITGPVLGAGLSAQSLKKSPQLEKGSL